MVDGTSLIIIYHLSAPINDSIKNYIDPLPFDLRSAPLFVADALELILDPLPLSSAILLPPLT